MEMVAGASRVCFASSCQTAAFARASSYSSTRPPSLSVSPATSASSFSLSGMLKAVGAKLAENRALRTAALWAWNTACALPAVAAEVAEEAEEKGKIFDFNFTLPIIAGEFLLLMVALDNIWFKPVSKVMDDRDEGIRKKLLAVREYSEEIKKLQEDAEAIIRAARAETTEQLNKVKRETAAELDLKLQESRKRIEKELADALANLEFEKEQMLKSLDKQVQELSDQIIAKLIPFKV